MIALLVERRVTVPPQSQQSAGTEERKQRVLTHGTPSITRTIADAVVIKNGDLFLLVEPDGRMPRGQGHGLGLYFQDCRFLRTYELTLNGNRLVALGSTSAPGDTATFELTNGDLELPGGISLPKEELGIRWEHRVAGAERSLWDILTVQNWGSSQVSLPFEFRFDAQFEDVFEVRGLLDEGPEPRERPEWDGGRLRFHHRGKDRRERSLEISFDGQVKPTGETTAQVTLELRPREVRRLCLKLVVAESDEPGAAAAGSTRPGTRSTAETDRSYATVRTDSAALDAILERSFSDVQLLTSELDGEEFFAAGLPWFGTLFGRDSIISALQILPFNPRIAESTLRLLARFQGQKVDEWRDEQPGKILHELRIGELASAGEIPHTPYYGSVDATPLFLILLAEHAQWTGQLRLFRELEANVGRALEWIDHYGDSDGDGYIEYQSSSQYGLINQGWKDSGNAILDAEGRLAEPPIALPEVQGYVYAAKLAVAGLYDRAGDPSRAEQLRGAAERLRAAFNRDFWIEDGGYYALALEAEKRPLHLLSSNAGQVLWSGIADPDKADRTAGQLLSDEMFSGWGVRTLSTAARGYNPIGYHLGTVWPHDNSIIAAGLRKYRRDGEAGRIFEGIVQAAMHFEHHRLPELFTGFSRQDYDEPIRYPVACHPQAWAAGSVPFLLQTSLGLEGDGFNHRLRVVRPMLPPGTDRVELENLEVGGRKLSLRLFRQQQGLTAVDAVAGSEVEVVVVPEGEDEHAERGVANG